MPKRFMHADRAPDRAPGISIVVHPRHNVGPSILVDPRRLPAGRVIVPDRRRAREASHHHVRVRGAEEGREGPAVRSTKRHDGAVGGARGGGLEVRDELNVVLEDLLGGQEGDVLWLERGIAEGQRLAVVALLGEEQHGAPLWRQVVDHEAVGAPERVDRALVARVEEDRALAPVGQGAAAIPVLGVDEVPVAPARRVLGVEVVEGLVVVLGLVLRGCAERDGERQL